MTRIVVAGAAGFMGSALVNELPGSVVSLKRSDVDLTDTEALTALLKPRDTIINAAGYADATDRSREGLERFQRSNVDAVRSIAEAAVKVGADHLIHISSVAAMGHVAGRGISEDHQLPARTDYAASKARAELVLRQFGGQLPITMLRPTSVFGEGRPLAAALCRVAARPLIPLPAGGRGLIPFTYIGNVVEAVRLTIGNERCIGKTFIVGDERSYTLREIMRAMADALDNAPRFVSIPTPAARLSVRSLEWVAQLMNRRAPIDRTRLETLTRSVEYSIVPFQRATGYVPPISLANAAARLAASHVNRESAGRR